MTTIRQKPANQQAVKKLEGFIISLKATLDKSEPPDFSARQNKYGVSKSTTSACKALGIIKKEGDGFVFKSEETPRTLALLILDYFLKQNKKTMRGDIMPDFKALMGTLGSIADKLTLLTVQNEVGLKRTKAALNGNIENADMFRVDEQRLYIAGLVAGALYGGFDDDVKISHNAIETTNKTIIHITDNLIKQLLNK